MPLFILRVHQNVINEHHKKLIQELHEHFVHHMHEESRGIGETKGHHGIFVKTVPSSECGLRNILLFNLELMISGPQINFGE